eukprot:955917-Pyramimonas_sp.AAC.1
MGARPWSYQLFSFGADATNPGMWRGAKLQALELESTHLENHAALTQTRFSEVSSPREVFSDLQEVEDGTSEATMALIIKQL